MEFALAMGPENTSEAMIEGEGFLVNSDESEN